MLNVELFRDCAYDLGFCFVENQLYDLAFYYLEVARMSGEIGATEEYINCLANSKSPLALESIERFLDAATNIRATSAEQIERWEFYVAFLKRRQVWVLIELEEFNRAKRLLQPLLEDPRCKDFAEKELRFLETLQQRGSNQTQG